MADGILASSIVQGVLAKIGSSIWAELSLVSSFRSDLKAMERDLASVRDVLFDAEARGGGGESAVRDWLRRLRDVAYDIDDLLDECRTDMCAARRRRSEDAPCGSVPSTDLCFLRSFAMARRLRSLRRALDAVAARRDKLRLNTGIHPPAHPSAPPRRETISMVDESKTVGRTADKEKLMRLVLDAASDEDVSVIPIVGFGGLGKTTLAQLVFNDRRANDEVFDPRIWVSMSVGSSLRTLVQPIVSATKEKCDLDNLDAVASFLSRTFTGKKYLLVLDDVWSDNQEEWDKLRMLLKDGKRGSKIIVTTRSRKVAMMVRTVPPFVLKGLSDDDCWELFRCKAFEEGEEDLHPKLVNVGKEIVQKCGGVPLAAKALGSMLRFNKSEQSWVDVKDSEIWQMEKEETILPSLKLSYDQMAPGLKQCFAYCSVFPRNHEIDRDKLIQQWIALGFVEPAKYGSQSVFDRANDCFEHLLWMSFLQEVHELDLSKKELEEEGNVKYKIHHLVHDLAQSVAGDEVQAINFNQDNGHSQACRYASLTADMGAPEVVRSMLRKVRAFNSWGYDLDINLVLHARCLRVLDLRGSPIIVLPQSVGKLKHLRYLDISSSPVKTLPNSISRLHNLHTLHLSNCSDLCILPVSICSLQNLETLNLSACSLHTLPDSIGHLKYLQNLNMSFCKFLETLPNSIGELQSLQTLNFKGCGKLKSLPDAICSLRKLQYLILSQCGILQSLPKSIGNLSNLFHLNLSQCNDLESIPDSICRITRLHTLNMSHCSSLSEIPVSIGGLKELQFLILSHHSSSLSLPISTGHLPNLQTLDLSWNIGLEELPESVGNLRNLKILILFQCWSLCRLPDSISNLVMLESLNLVGCEQLTKLPDGIISLSNLKHLKNDQCNTLERIPHGFGQWTKLETLSVLIIGDGYSNIAELENLNLLTGVLRIECWSHKKDLTTDAKRANLRIKRKLSSLTLSWTASYFCEDPTSVEMFLEVLVPPENLEVLEIDGYKGTKFPSWMMKSMEMLLPNLVSLSLSNIHGCNCLPPLGHLPYLQSLQLRHITGVRSMVSEVPVGRNKITLYQSLKELHFEDMPNLEIWPTSWATDHKGNQSDLFMFPVLKTVTVTECPKLRPMPCLPDAIADLQLSRSSEMVSSWRISQPSPMVSTSLLRRLWIKSCHVSSNKWMLLRHRPKLEDLVIEYCETLDVLPDAIRSLGTLRTLKILNCTELEALPEWLGELITIESLEISCCPKLVSLPKGLQCLTVLKELTISGCSSVLNERCTKDTGRDWFNIRHVPSIVALPPRSRGLGRAPSPPRRAAGGPFSLFARSLSPTRPRRLLPPTAPPRASPPLRPRAAAPPLLRALHPPAAALPLPRAAALLLQPSGWARRSPRSRGGSARRWTANCDDGGGRAPAVDCGRGRASRQPPSSSALSPHPPPPPPTHPLRAAPPPASALLPRRPSSRALLLSPRPTRLLPLLYWRPALLGARCGGGQRRSGVGSTRWDNKDRSTRRPSANKSTTHRLLRFVGVASSASSSLASPSSIALPSGPPPLPADKKITTASSIVIVPRGCAEARCGMPARVGVPVCSSASSLLASSSSCCIPQHSSSAGHQQHRIQWQPSGKNGVHVAFGSAGEHGRGRRKQQTKLQIS